MPLITISQDFASGGFLIAKEAAESLGVKLYDDKALKKKAIAIGIRSDNLAGVEEKKPRFFDRLLHKTPEIYLDVLQQVVYGVAEAGDGLIFGHGSQVLLKDFDCALHVRIIAPIEKRIERAMAKRGIDREYAEKIITNKDSQWNGFFQYAFKRDIADPSLYDLIINTNKISDEQAARQIIDLAKSDEMKACSLKAMATMQRLGLEKKIHAALLSVGVTLNMIHISVLEKGEVEVGGYATDEEEKALMTKTIEKLEGVDKVTGNILLRPYSGFG